MQFPGPVRAVVGLLADAATEARQLPERAVELPMLAVSTAMQLSLRAQQRYARLAARGDEVLQRHRPTDEPPAWATFDEPLATTEVPGEPVVGATGPDDQLADEPALGKGVDPSAPKGVSAPRHTAPSRFDAVDDE